MRHFLSIFLQLLTAAPFLDGLAQFLANANLPHTSHEVGEMVGSALFFLYLRWRDKQQMRAHVDCVVTAAVNQVATTGQPIPSAACEEIQPEPAASGLAGGGVPALSPAASNVSI